MIKKLLFCILFILVAIRNSYSQISFTESAIPLGVTANYGSIPGGLGGGVSFCDFDNDGWDDLTFSTAAGDTVRFFKNNSGTFTEITLNGVLLASKETRQVIWVDYDNDGDKDLFIATADDSNKLYQNNGSFLFTDVTASAGFDTSPLYTYGCSWGDYNNDGYLDAFLCFRDPNELNPNKLYMNNGNGTFTDVTASAGLDNTSGYLSFCSSFIDYDNDGWQDIYIANDKPDKKNIMYHNNGDGTFTDTSIATGTDIGIDAMSTTVADYDNDGDLDIYVTNTFDGNVFLRNNGNSTFTDIANSNGTLMESIAWGAVFLDADNDMDTDLYVSSMLTDTSSELPSAFYENNGANMFSIPSNAGFDNDDAVSFSNAIGDIDNDGYPDITVSNFSPRNHFLFNNNSDSNNYLKVKLQGTSSNRDGIGSWIQAYTDGNPQNRYTLAGEGYTSQNSNYEFFGFGTETLIDSLKVTWLSGTVDILYDVAVNQSLTIVEGSSLSIDTYNLESNIKLYPNPSSNGIFQLKLTFENLNKEYSYKIFDAMGRELLAEKILVEELSIDLSKYNSGIYFIEITNGQNAISKKLVKN